MKQAQKMQKDLKKAQEEISQLDIETTTGGGAIMIKMSGNYQVKSLKIDEDLFKDDKEMVEDMLMVAINNAVTQVKEESEKRMSSVSGGIPGMPGLM